MYTLISYDADTRVAIIQVDGCTKQTQASIPQDVVPNSPDWDLYLLGVAQDVTKNMDPMSSTYDPSLLS